MTTFDDCILIWRGKDESQAKQDLIEFYYPLRVIESIGASEYSKGWRNRLILGENYHIMTSLLEEFSGKINVIYIDPPFASGSIFKKNVQLEENNKEMHTDSLNVDEVAFKDTWGRDGLSSYLQMMYERLILMKDLLAKNGSIFVHLDWHAYHYVKVMLDEIFGYKNFRTDIIWQRTPGHHLSSTMDVMTDVILWYSKTSDYVYNQQYQLLTQKEEREKFPFVEEETGRRFTHEKLEQSSNAYSIGEKRIINGRVMTTKVGWRWTQKTFDIRLEENPNLIFWTGKGRPRYKRYADEYLGRKIGNLWLDVPSLASNEKERLNYPTQKPEMLLERIIKMSSNEGDLIADFFCGSGTTLAAAEKLNRRWLGVDSSKYAINLVKKRLVALKDSKDLIFKCRRYNNEAKSFEILTISRVKS